MKGSSRINRWIGVTRMGLQRIRHRIATTGGRRLLLSVVGVAIAIGLVVTVTGVSIGLATGTTVYGEDVDYWIVPESASASTMAVNVGGPSFGAVHPTAERIEALEAVSNATPVAINTVRMTAGNQSEYIVLIGVIPAPDMTIVGANTGNLTAGDPYYNNGNYNGTWTGEMLLSQGAAELLNASVGSEVGIGGSSQTFTVKEFSSARVASGAGTLPTAVVHLAEAQALSDRMGSDSADQFLVKTQTQAVKSELAGIYPESKVITRTGSGVQAVTSAELPLAMALGGFLVSIIVGSLFVATAMGMEVTSDRRRFATLEAVGFSTQSQMLLISVQTLILTMLGGIGGVLLGWAGVRITNNLAQRWVTDTAIATFDPLLIPYGIGIAIIMGLFTLPYLVWITARSPTIRRLSA